MKSPLWVSRGLYWRERLIRRLEPGLLFLVGLKLLLVLMHDAKLEIAFGRKINSLIA